VESIVVLQQQRNWPHGRSLDSLAGKFRHEWKYWSRFRVAIAAADTGCARDGSSCGRAGRLHQWEVREAHLGYDLSYKNPMHVYRFIMGRFGAWVGLGWAPNLRSSGAARAALSVA